MFREDYRKEMQKLTPDSSFLQGLSAEMEREGQNLSQAGRELKNRKNRWKAAGWGVCAAVLAGIGVGITWFGAQGTVHMDENVMTQNAGGVPGQGKDREGIFAGSSWYGSEEDQRKIYQILTEKLSGDEALQLTVSETDNFEDARVLSFEETENLVEMLKRGKLSASYKDVGELQGGQPIYYLAEFSDGVTVKFSVYGEQYFYCSEIDGVFELKD